jgi:dihydrolipoamide dehydrogenase
MTAKGAPVDKKRLILLLVAAVAITLFFAFDAGRFLTLEYLKASQQQITSYYLGHRLSTIAAFFIFYIALTALSLPGAAIMTIAGGAFFGLVPATIVVSFASSIGATLAFLASRLVLGTWVQKRFGDRLRTINEGIEKDGALYLFAMRLVAVFPFFLINLLMGLTPIRPWTFYWVSQLGMLAGTVVYVNLGTELARIDSLADVLQPGLLFAFALLGLLPLLARKAIAALRSRKVYARWAKPRQFDYNLVVIGAGSAGLVSAYLAAALEAKVALIEKERMGGDCLYTGCVPSKALIRSAAFLAQIARAKEFGIRSASANFEFSAIMNRVARVIERIEPHDSPARYSALGVECIEGQGKMTSPWTVEIESASGRRVLTTKAIVIATGARPTLPRIPGFEDIAYLTSETVWSLDRQPQRLLVLGGGPLGAELAQAFARLGSSVTLLEMQARLLPREDPEVSEVIEARFEAEGIRVLTNHTAVAFTQRGGAKSLRATSDGIEIEIPFDEVLVAVGRSANTRGCGLEELGIGTTSAGTVETNANLETIYPNIYACGDVAGPYQLTHAAAHQAWYATVNALFGRWHKLKADYSAIPAATFTDPEVARVGLNEAEARSKGVAFDVTVFGLEELDRAIADGEAYGFVKVLTRPGADRLLGVTIVGPHAADLLAEYVLAMKHRLGLNKILGTVHAYPTLAEANKYAAGVWKRSTVTAGQRSTLEAVQAWARGERSVLGVLGTLKGLLMDKRKSSMLADEP